MQGFDALAPIILEKIGTDLHLFGKIAYNICIECPLFSRQNPFSAILISNLKSET